MKETTDIQKFQRLFAAWLEAGTNLEQEQELLQLAHRLLDTDCAAPTLRDAELVRLSIAPRPSKADADEFGTFLDSLTARQRPRRKKWMYYAAAAAVSAIVATVGLNMPQRPEPAPIANETVTQPQSVPAEPVLTAKAEQPALTEKPHLTEKSYKSGRPGRTDSAALPAKPQETTELLEPREITDPQEAAEVLGKSCALLADCVKHAEEESQKALDTFAENINLVNEII